tara:strand:+ start:1438 stop:2124 length:687 start_codon:yes stop_codon:yes gene_type:complete
MNEFKVIIGIITFFTIVIGILTWIILSKRYCKKCQKFKICKKCPAISDIFESIDEPENANKVRNDSLGSACIGLKMVSTDPKIKQILVKIEAMRDTIQHDLFCQTLSVSIKAQKKAAKKFLQDNNMDKKTDSINCKKYTQIIDNLIENIQNGDSESILHTYIPDAPDMTMINKRQMNYLMKTFLLLFRSILVTVCNSKPTTLISDVFNVFESLLRTVCPSVDLTGILS